MEKIRKGVSMAIFISKCSIGKCMYRVVHRDMDEKIVHVLCSKDNRICDFDSCHPNSHSCRHFPYLSCMECSLEWGCDAQ